MSLAGDVPTCSAALRMADGLHVCQQIAQWRWAFTDGQYSMCKTTMAASCIRTSVGVGPLACGRWDMLLNALSPYSCALSPPLH